jgi:hypothetical protein
MNFLRRFLWFAMDRSIDIDNQQAASGFITNGRVQPHAGY